MSILKKSILFTGFVFILLNLNSCRQWKTPDNEPNSRLLELKKEISEDLTGNLLPYWAATCQTH
jgi:hypothetical protein